MLKEGASSLSESRSHIVHFGESIVAYKLEEIRAPLTTSHTPTPHIRTIQFWAKVPGKQLRFINNSTKLVEIVP